MIASLASSLPPVVPFRVPSPRITEGDLVVRADAHITGQEKLDSTLLYEFNEVNDVRISAKHCATCVSAQRCTVRIVLQ